MNTLRSKFLYHNKLYKKFGLRALLFLLRYKFKKNKTDVINVKSIKYPISLSNFNNDVNTLFQIFFAGEYDVILKNIPSVIIDCGANIGLSAVFFANKYPSATIIALEPDTKNFKYLKKNTLYYTNIICLKKAIWSRPATMNIVNPGTGNWGLQTIETDTTNADTVDAVTIDQILKEYSLAKIDLLKIDIEGAEKELFSENYENWISKTGVLAIELHEFLDKKIPATFFNAIGFLKYKHYYQGENLICEFDTN